MKEVEFIGRVERQIYSSDNYKMYSVVVDKDKYPGIKFTIYGTATIAGNLHSLTPEAEYLIKATEKNGNRGYLYNVVNIKKTALNSVEDAYAFLQEVLTFDQASELYREYPNIVDLVINGKADEVVDLRKLHGIGNYRFNVIKDKIIENYALYDLINEFKGVLTIAMLKKLYEKYPSIEKIRSELRTNPYKCLCKLNRVGFKTADALLVDMEKDKIIKFDFDLKTSKERCLACMMYLLEDNEAKNGSTKMSIVDLRSQVMKLTPACANHFVECLKNNKDDIFYNKETLNVALMHTYMTEVKIAENIVDRLKNNKKIYNVDVTKYKEVNGINLSEEQISFLDCVCKNPITVLAAPGGTGKSFSTQALINIFKDNNISFILASPTGKAAKKLSEYTKESANTIHRTLGFANGKFEYNEDNQLNCDVLLLDEVGMTDISLFLHLLKATPINTKIVLVGDKFQLNSVGAGALLRDLIATDFIKQINFTKVYRMGEGGVLTACTYIRENKKFLSENKFTQIGSDKSYSFIPATSQNINSMIIALYKKLIEKNDPKDITVLSSYNVGENGCSILNNLLQPIANPNAKSSNTCVKIKQDKLDVCYYVGDSVIATVNNYKAKIFLNDNITEEKCLICNGDQGKVVKIINNGLVIDFDGVEIYYSYGELQSLKHAFACSIHKMQGSQNKIIIFAMPSSHTYMLSNNICYTAVSRAEKTVYHFGDVKTLNYIMNKSDSEKRETMLKELLKEKYNEIHG